ncbi:glycosyltransferase family 39 protein [Rhizobium sp. KVB221]|uniref:Glycosyltransferase family 39 protein n=1 Tax=Rhizobium setariae TaxID=2801340 RepID=A0A937CKW9_9HYPH|nr:glycosyltransferase family 39 protein [Rhizobium setariae]MBL0372575.1 glycosyltransferase family 39 protein [Rhizobium setariae]
MMASERKPATILFIALAVYFLANIAVRLSLPATLELDEAEQIFYSQWLTLGYGPQPPLYNWLQTAVFAVTGRSIFGLSLLKNALLFSCYFFYWLAACQVLRDSRLRIVAVLGLLALPQVSFMAQQDLAHTVALLSATALFLYAFYRIVAAPDTTAYLLAGVAVGAGFLAKYNFPLLPIAALLAVLPEKNLRDRIFNWRLVMAMALAFAIVLPHALWLLQNFDHATSATLGKMTENGDVSVGPISAVRGIGSMAVAIAAFSAVIVLIFVAVYRRSAWTVLKAQSVPIRITERMIALLAVALIAIVVATGTVHVRERWLDPFLLVLPLYLCMKIEAAGKAGAITRKGLLVIPLAIMLAIPASIFLRVTTTGMTGAYTKLNIPFDEFAKKLTGNSVTPAVVIAQDRHLAGNMKLNVGKTPVMTAQFPNFKLPFDWNNDQAVLLVWRSATDASVPAQLKQWVSDNATTGTISTIGKMSLPYHYGREGDRYDFSYAWVTAPKIAP